MVNINYKDNFSKINKNSQVMGNKIPTKTKIKTDTKLFYNCIECTKIWQQNIKIIIIKIFTKNKLNL